MGTNSQDLIKQLKETRAKKKITYNEILNELSVNGTPSLSMTTLRRVFSAGSEDKASSFNYEETLLPISEAMKRIAGDEDSPQAREIEALRSMISIQSEAIDRIMEFKQELSASVEKMSEQIQIKDNQMIEKDSLIRRLIDRLDQKDEIIHQFLIDLKQKDEIIRELTNKYISKE